MSNHCNTSGFVHIVNSLTVSTKNLSTCYTKTKDGLNFTDNSSFRHEIWTPDVIQRVASLAFIMTLTLVGNTVILVALTCSRYGKRNSRVNVFIVNLAVGDLAVCFCTMTTEIFFVAFGQWVLGPVACKLLTYLQIVTLASTTFILTSMSFDRYLAICKPLRYRASIRHVRNLVCLCWTMAFIFAVPQLFIFVQVRNFTTGTLECKTVGYTADWQRKLYFSILTLYILIVPVVLISFCYLRIIMTVSRLAQDIRHQKHPPTKDQTVDNGDDNSGLRRSGVKESTFPKAKIKTLKMTFAIIATFVLCWSPYFITTLILIYSDYLIHVPASVMAFAETTALLQSALNPLLYGCFNVKLKRHLLECCRRRKLCDHSRMVNCSKNSGMTESCMLTEDIVSRSHGTGCKRYRKEQEGLMSIQDRTTNKR